MIKVSRMIFSWRDPITGQRMRHESAVEQTPDGAIRALDPVSLQGGMVVQVSLVFDSTVHSNKVNVTLGGHPPGGGDSMGSKWTSQSNWSSGGQVSSGSMSADHLLPGQGKLIIPMSAFDNLLVPGDAITIEDHVHVDGQRVRRWVVEVCDDSHQVYICAPGEA
jgi:hypothetical protein